MKVSIAELIIVYRLGLVTWRKNNKLLQYKNNQPYVP